MSRQRMILTIDMFDDFEVKTLAASDGDRRLWIIANPKVDELAYGVEDRKSGESWILYVFNDAMDQFNAV